jgi:uncharacterized membrane protein
MVTSYHPLHPLHAILLAFPIALFTAALVTDITYLQTAEIQWSNFSSWLIAGALFFGAPVMIWAGIIAARQKHWRAAVYALLVAAMWIAGLINAFQHSRDAWSSVETGGLLLSIFSTLAALAAGWVAHMAPSRERSFT